MRFTPAELEQFRGATLPDLLGADVRLLFVGINPGLRTVAVQAHFGQRGNRFQSALFRAGLLGRLIDASDGRRAGDREYLLGRGIGITNLVAGATASADELTSSELIDGACLLTQRIPQSAPKAVAVLGITAYRIAFQRPRAVMGRQPEDLAGTQLWVVPHPSGLNAHVQLDDLARAYREVAAAGGIDVRPPVG